MIRKTKPNRAYGAVMISLYISTTQSPVPNPGHFWQAQVGHSSLAPRASSLFSKHCKKGILGDMAWVVGFLNEDVKASLDALPSDIRASFQRISELIQAHGLERVREPYVKHLEGTLWEMRMKGKSGIARHRSREKDRRCPCLCEEDPENA